MFELVNYENFDYFSLKMHFPWLPWQPNGVGVHVNPSVRKLGGFCPHDLWVKQVYSPQVKETTQLL